MRSSLSRKSRDVVSGLCSACAKQQRRLATIESSSSSSAVRSYATATTNAITTRSRTPVSSTTSPSTLTLPRRRWASSSSASPSSSTTATSPSSSPAQQQQHQQQPPAYYYSLFPQTLKAGPPPGGPFEIDLAALRREFLRLQAAAHPDVFHHQSARAEGGGGSSSSSSGSSRTSPAHAASATLNVAHRTLASPLLRAQYLLRELHGIDLAADEAGAAAGPAGTDPDVLLTAMDALAAVEDAEHEADLDDVRRDNDARVRACVDGLADAFAAGDVPRAVELAVRLRYWSSVDEAVRGWERGRGVVLEH